MRLRSEVATAKRRCLAYEALETRLCLDGDPLPCLLTPPDIGTADRAIYANNCFALDLYQHFQAEQGNIVFSPTSIVTALAMAYAGAGGTTADEMQQTLHFGSEPGIHESFRDLIAMFDAAGENSEFVLQLTNAIWPDNDFPIRAEYVDRVADNYGGHASNVDYSNPTQAEEIINGWISRNTDGRITDLVKDLDPATLLVLTNAIYFNAQWLNPFNPDSTSTGYFYPTDGPPVITPMMSMIDPGFEQGQLSYYTEIYGFQVLELPFTGEASSMLFVMPESLAGPYELTPSLMSQIDTWRASPREYTQVDIFLPKFEMKVDSTINALLSDMGMPSAFVSGADFSGISDGIHIAKVGHQAVIEVNEQGTEAAAATYVELVLCFAAGTPVLTPDGEKPIEQLRPGDLVLARDANNIEGDVEPKRIDEVLRGHSAVVRLEVGGQIIRVTSAHRFFVRGKGWTPVAEMRVGDLMATCELSGWQAVTAVSELEEPQPVYNFRVVDHHTYFVGRKAWGFSLWTHNEYGGPSFIADHPFHFMIRDNTTSAILFMGRVSDPTQLRNDITPRVSASLPGDFNGDSQFDEQDIDALIAAVQSQTTELRFDLDENNLVDSHDIAYLVESILDTRMGDANLDGAVDAEDFQAWQSHAFSDNIGWSQGNLNGDLVVDVSDFNVWYANRFHTAQPAASSVARVPRAPLYARQLQGVPSDDLTLTSQTCGPFVVTSRAADSRTSRTADARMSDTEAVYQSKVRVAQQMRSVVIRRFVTGKLPTATREQHLQAIDGFHASSPMSS